MKYVLDTSALKWAYLPSSRHYRRLRTLVSRQVTQTYIAEITLLEIVNALGAQVRGRKISAVEFGVASDRVLGDVASGALLVREFRRTDLIACRHLLALAGIGALANLSSQDGMIAYTARQLALESATGVTLLSSDRGLCRVVSSLPHFTGLVRAEYVSPT